MDTVDTGKGPSEWAMERARLALFSLNCYSDDATTPFGRDGDTKVIAADLDSAREAGARDERDACAKVAQLATEMYVGLLPAHAVGSHIYGVLEAQAITARYIYNGIVVRGGIAMFNPDPVAAIRSTGDRAKGGAA